MTAAVVPSDAASPARDRRSTLLVWGAFAIAALLAGALLLHVGRGLTWFFDEWDWVQGRRTGSLDDLLRDHNGHLVALPMLAYKLSWQWFGLRGYTAMRVLTVVLHIGTCALLLVWLRRRVRDELALAAVVMVLFLGFAWQDLIWPSQIAYLGSTVGGIAALVFLDRRDRTGDVLAAVFLGVSLASSGLGLPFVGAVGLVLVLRRATWKRLWVPIAPLVLYAAWYVAYGKSQAKSDNAHLVPEYVEKAGAAAAGALFGRGIDLGHVVLAAVVVLVVVVSIVRRRVTPELAGVVALPILFWGLTALGRAQANEPGASRYLYPGAIFVVMVLAQLVDDPEFPRERRARLALGAVAAVLVVVSLVGNVRELRNGAESLRLVSTTVKAELAALEAARDAGPVADDYRPDLSRAPQIIAGPYFRAVDDLGSPADRAAEVRARPEEVRAAADTVLLGALRVQLARAAAPTDGTPPALTAVEGNTAPAGACTVVEPTGGRATVDLAGASPSITVVAGDTPVDVAARNLADGFEGGAIGAVDPGASGALTLPAVRLGPWTVRLSSPSAFRVC